MRHFIVIIIVLMVIPSAAAQDKVKTDAFGDPLPAGAVQRIGTTRWRLPDANDPYSVRLSPDAKHLAALNYDGTIDIWELPAWDKCRSLRSPSSKYASRFQTLQFTADGTSLVASDSVHRLCLFRLATGKCTHQIDLPQGFHLGAEASLAISQDRLTLVCSGAAGLTHMTLVWNLADNKLARSIPVANLSWLGNPVPLPTPAPSCPSFIPVIYVPEVLVGPYTLSSDCRRLAIGNTIGKGDKKQNHVVELWDCATGKPTLKIATAAPLVRMAFSPDAKWLLFLSNESTLCLYETATGKALYTLRLRDRGIRQLVFAPDSQSFYLTSDESQTRLTQWKSATGERMAVYSSPLDLGVQQLGFPSPGKPVALAQVGSIIHCWEVTTGKVLSATKVSRRAIRGVHFSQPGELFVGGEDGQAAWWNPRTGRKLQDLRLDALKTVSYRPLAIMAVHGEFLVHYDPCASHEAPAGISDARTGKLLYHDESKWPETLSLFANGQKAASLQGKTVRLWHTRSGRDFGKFDLPLVESPNFARMTVSENGRYFAVAALRVPLANGQPGDCRVVLWDHEKRTLLHTWPIASLKLPMLRFSADNQWLAFTESDTELRLIRLGQGLGGTVLKPRMGEQIQCVAFSPEGRQLACATAPDTKDRQPGRIVIYELASKKIRRELVGHAAGVIHCLAYSPDAALLASGSSDTTALLWQADLRSILATEKDSASRKDLATAFAQMAGEDARAAFDALIYLVQSPQETVALLSEKIPPAVKPDLQSRSVAEWIGDLGSKQYAVRIKAAALLYSIGPGVEADLRTALARPKDLETKRRIEDLLARLAARELTPQEILHVRAVELVETIASKQARALLTRWTTGEPGATLTEEARAALLRMPE